jgi:hypothetical protein
MAPAAHPTVCACCKAARESARLRAVKLEAKNGGQLAATLSCSLCLIQRQAGKHQDDEHQDDGCKNRNAMCWVRNDKDMI